jgi:hypothetical protein
MESEEAIMARDTKKNKESIEANIGREVRKQEQAERRTEIVLKRKREAAEAAAFLYGRTGNRKQVDALGAGVPKTENPLAETSQAVAPSIEPVTETEGEVNVNKLAAQALRAKLLGKMNLYLYFGFLLCSVICSSVLQVQRTYRQNRCSKSKKIES